MDEFSWFVGLYEGEGSFYSRVCKKKYKRADGTIKKYENGGIVLTLKMTDEDTIARAAKFLGQKYAIVDKKSTDKTGYKTLYRTRVMGGVNDGNKLYELMKRMLPHLSQRRQEQINGHIDKVKD